jgi:hypothetical protein
MIDNVEMRWYGKMPNESMARNANKRVFFNEKPVMITWNQEIIQVHSKKCRTVDELNPSWNFNRSKY